VIPSPSPQSGPRAAERGIVPDSSARGTGDRGLSAQGSQGASPGAPGSRASTGSGIAGSQRGPAIPAPGPTLREKLFDTEVMGKIAKREEKEHNNSITFDTKEFKYETYMMRLKDRIEGIWKYPPDAARRGINGDLLIEFTIKKNGKLGDVELVRTSGRRDLDEAAMQALKDGEPYWPLPDEWGKDSLTIRGHFVYSIYGTYIR
jgi:protein TonB